MNKNLMKQVLRDKQIPCVKSIEVFAEQFRSDKDRVIREILEGVGLPVIIKPAHLGSSIGINTARDKAALLANLSTAALLDNEILVEKLLEDFTEYNVSVRKIKEKVECSEIERPKKQDEILSFADKYEREGGKKQSGTQQGGMAGLTRDLPAKISEELRQKVIGLAKRVFKECRLDGMVRIDMLFENATGELYVNEINPIPGSMAFYLWESSGIQFQEQITQSIERAFEAKDEREAYRLEYETNIVEKFVNQ
jgi:D-alanine-D-alanine ligase